MYVLISEFIANSPAETFQFLTKKRYSLRLVPLLQRCPNILEV